MSNADSEQNSKIDPFAPTSAHRCNRCHVGFDESYCLKHFTHKLCDSCFYSRDRFNETESKGELISQTQAYEEYLLTKRHLEGLVQSVDGTDSRFEPLGNVIRRNPHNRFFPSMKLYLREQVLKRALEVHGSLDAIEELKKRKMAVARKRVQNKHEKALKKLRVSVRWNERPKPATQRVSEHVHRWDKEVRNAGHRTCLDCGVEVVLEEL
ncbi:hypothetical protein ACOME3_004121 [Neoechinorhynchus agilis]